MKTHQSWIIFTIVGIVCSLLAIAAFVAITDPLFQYHSLQDHIGYFAYKSEPYQNPGIIKNSQYDALSTGSSMTENMDVKYMDSVMNQHTLKASFSGANARNVTDAITLAVEHNPELKRVFCSLDHFSFEDSVMEEGNSMPSYLKDDLLFTDAKYWFNQDILFDYSVENVLWTKRGMNTNWDFEKIGWYGFPYGDQKVIDSLGSHEYQKDNMPQDIFSVNTSQNLQTYWIPLIENTPDIEYYLFIPPYSILWWHSAQISGLTDGRIQMYKTVAQTLSRYENVHLFCFLDAYDKILNLYNYKDTAHYHFRLNDWMVDCFADEQYLVTPENIDSRFAELSSFVKAFDYSIYFENELLQICNLSEYLPLVNNERYIIFAAGKNLDISTIADLQEWSLTEYVDETAPFYIVWNGDNQIPGESEIYDTFLQHHTVQFFSVEHDGSENQWVEIDGVPYGNNQAGVNFVVWDLQNSRVADAVSFTLDGSWPADRLHPWVDFPWLRIHWQNLG